MAQAGHQQQFCLRWNDFQTNIKASFGDLRNDQNFTDVTLACEDDQHLEAHKVILTAPSPNFKEKYETEKNKSDNLEVLNKQHVSEIEKLQMEIKQLKNEMERISEEINVVKEGNKKDIKQFKKEIEKQKEEINKQKEKQKKEVKNKERENKNQLELVSDKMMKIITEENKDNREDSETYFNFLGDTSIEIPDIPDIFKCDKCGYMSCINSSLKYHKCKEQKRTKRK